MQDTDLWERLCHTLGLGGDISASVTAHTDCTAWHYVCMRQFLFEKYTFSFLYRFYTVFWRSDPNVYPGTKRGAFLRCPFHSKVTHLIPQQLNLRLLSALGAPQFIFFSNSRAWVAAELKLWRVILLELAIAEEEAVRWLSDGCKGRPMLSLLPLDKSCQSFEAVLVHDHLIVWTSHFWKRRCCCFLFLFTEPVTAFPVTMKRFSSPVFLPSGDSSWCNTAVSTQGGLVPLVLLSLDKEWSCSVITPS